MCSLTKVGEMQHFKFLKEYKEYLCSRKGSVSWQLDEPQ